MILGLVVLVQLVPFVALGQAASSEPGMTGMERRARLQEEVRERRETLQTITEDRRESLRREMEARREQMRQNIEERRQRFQERAAARREELKKRLGEKRAENIERLFSNMVEKFEKAVIRLNDGAAKLSVAIDKAVAEGADVTDAQAQLAVAENNIAMASDALEAAKAKYTAMTTADNTKASFVRVQAVVQDLGQKIRAAHRELMAVVPLVRSAAQSGNATTTPSTSSAQ